MKNLVLFFCQLCYLIVFSQEKQKVVIKDGGYWVECEQVNGRLQGSYVSYYKNGIKKAEGQFRHNTRIGIWKVWDSLGNLNQQRNYIDHQNYKLIYPKLKRNKTLRLLSDDSHGLDKMWYGKITVGLPDNYRFRNITERMIYPSENEMVYYEKIFNIIREMYVSKNIECYKVYDHCIDTLLLSNKRKKLVGFNIEEREYFDLNRKINISYITGINPIIIDTTFKYHIQKTTIPLDSIELSMGWYYYNIIRENLNEVQDFKLVYPEYIKTLDDIFYYRCFSSEVIKQSILFKYKNQNIVNFNEALTLSKKLGDILNIEKEHDYWMYYNQLE